MSRRAVAIAALILASLAVTARPGAGAPAAVGPFGELCTYVEGGPPGPRGNRLVVVDEGTEPWLVRRGDEIRIREAALGCSGPQATVHNVDRIVLKVPYSNVTLDERRGAFAPGATGERSGSEIEIDIEGAVKLTVYGRRRPDSMQIGSRANGDYALNLDRAADGRAPDSDVFVRHDGFKALRVHAGQGDDMVDARRLTGIGDNVYLKGRVRLFGGSGDDTILGGRGEEMLFDGPGNDLIRAGGGGDFVEFGPGRDTIYGGRGDDGLFYRLPLEVSRGRRDLPDRLFGGPGADTISDDNGQADVIHCGPGEDLLDVKGPDRGSGCEHHRHGHGDLI